MDYGMKIALPGYDAKTATPEQCAVHSSYPPLKSRANQAPPHYATLRVDFTKSTTQGSTVTLYAINHNYGYIPLNFASIKFNDTFQNIYGTNYAGVGATLMIRAYCTTTQFIMTLYDDAVWTRAGAVLEVSYYIFAENGS